MNVYPFIEAEKAQQRNVKRACELLEVSRAAYYAHRANTPSARQRADEALTPQLRIHLQVRRDLFLRDDVGDQDAAVILEDAPHLFEDAGLVRRQIDHAVRGDEVDAF